MASNLTISAILLGSTGGSLMNRAKLACPLTPIATAPPLAAVLLGEIRQRGLEKRFAVIAGLGEDLSRVR